MIYVDDYEGRFGRMVMCHMMSDASLDELHEFAAKISMRREWFQDKSAPHYDVCKSRRRVALRAGAVEVGVRTEEWRRVYRAAKLLKNRGG